MRDTARSVAVALLLAPLGQAQTTPVAIRGATLLTGAGETIDSGTIVLEGGKIMAVGADVLPPEGAAIIEAKGLYATPGLIDAYSHVGFGASAGPGRSTTWDRETLMVPSRHIAEALSDTLSNLGASQWLRAGVTTAYVSPGGQNLVGGHGALVKLTGKLIRSDAAVSGSFGETTLDAFDTPTTRQGLIAILRQTLVRAQEDAIEGEDGRTFAQILTGELPFRLFVNTPDDIMTSLRIGREFGVDLVLDSAAGGHLVAEAIAAGNVPVVVGPAIIGIGDGGPYEGFAHTPSNAASLHRAGVRIALGTGGYGTGRSVAMEAVVAKSHGLPEEAALTAVTSDAAAILGVGDRLGTLATGMDADVVLWDVRPISTWARTKRVIVDGETVFER